MFYCYDLRRRRGDCKFCIWRTLCGLKDEGTKAEPVEAVQENTADTEESNPIKRIAGALDSRTARQKEQARFWARIKEQRAVMDGIQMLKEAIYERQAQQGQNEMVPQVSVQSDSSRIQEA